MSDPYCKFCGVIEDLHNKMYCKIVQNELHTFIKVYKKMNDYKEALERIRDCDWVITLPDRMDAVRAIAKEALI